MMRKLDRGEIQDRFPDFVHGTLPADERAQIEAAIAADTELAAELEAVRYARAALTVAAESSLDVDRVVAALPRAGAKPGLRVSRWRIAAAIATIAVGGASLGVIQGYRGEQTDGLTISGETTTAAVDAGLEISFGYDLSALTEEQLAALLADLEQSNGLPPAEPRTPTAVSSNNEGDVPQ